MTAKLEQRKSEPSGAVIWQLDPSCLAPIESVTDEDTAIEDDSENYPLVSAEE